jgi:hypothetical protein
LVFTKKYKRRIYVSCRAAAESASTASHGGRKINAHIGIKAKRKLTKPNLTRGSEARVSTKNQKRPGGLSGRQPLGRGKRQCWESMQLTGKNSRTGPARANSNDGKQAGESSWATKFVRTEADCRQRPRVPDGQLG